MDRRLARPIDISARRPKAKKWPPRTRRISARYRRLGIRAVAEGGRGDSPSGMVRDGNALFVIAGDTTGAGMTSYAADPELGNALEPLCAAAIVCL